MISLFFSIFIIAGFSIIFRGDKRLKVINEMKIWPKTVGTVISFSFHEDIVSEYDDTTTYVPVIKYSYTVNKDIYTSTRLSFTYNSDIIPNTSKDAFTTLADKYKEGQSVDVYYNPNKVSYSVLFTDTPDESVNFIKGYMMFGYIVMFISTYLTVTSLVFSIK